MIVLVSANIVTEEQLKNYLKTQNIDVDMFTYKPGMDDDYLMNHPWVMKNRVYYNSPSFWRTLFDKNIEPAIKYLMTDTRVDPVNLGLCNTCLYTDREEAFTLCERHLNALSDDKEKSIDLNGFMWVLVQQNKVDELKRMIELAEKLKISPVHKSWGNIAYGDAISESVKFDDDKLFNFLIQYELDPGINDSMPFCIACKYGHYAKALKLANKGYDIKAMHSLGLKMIKRNDKSKMPLSAEEALSRKSLLTLYGETEE